MANESKKKYLESKKQLRVWTDPLKYELFAQAVKDNGLSIYKVINDFMEEYIEEEKNIKEKF